MADLVWASNAMINPAMLRPISNIFDDGTSEGRAVYSEARDGNDAGKSLPIHLFPSDIFVRKDADTNYDRLPDLFFAGSYWVVSGAVADVMRQFDLGGCNLYPTKVFRKDRKTPIGDRWFCLNFGNVKRAFLPDESTYRTLGPSRTFWMAPTMLNDNSTAVSRTALAGPDIWIDAIVGDVFFLSDRLAQALKAAGVARAFGLKKCRVI